MRGKKPVKKTRKPARRPARKISRKPAVTPAVTPARKPARRPSSFEQGLQADFEQELAAVEKVAAEYVATRRRALVQKVRVRRAKALAVVKKFKPGARARGKIIFVGLDGKQIKGRSNRKGYAVYVNRSGKKQLIRSYDRRKKRVTKWPEAKKLKSLDVTRAKSKRARKEFLTQFLTPAAAGQITRKPGAKGLNVKRVRYGGELAMDKFYFGSDSVKTIARDLAKACNAARSRKDFLVSVGFWLKDKDGKAHFVEINRRFARQDGQTTDSGETAGFLGKEVYGFLAKELTMRGLVLAGSAGHIRRLKQNRGVERDEWTKGVFLWEGHDALDATIEKIEYRIDQQSFGK